ncbi:MAG TPA: TetR/AcrR family transcriptional regulator [Candidatus Acidoferrum sp.]|nr:TetR/AcrR family transcriptional regulator [Candidatus Acidoferrum sp.]
MSPRPYRSVARQAASVETRSRILAAARELLGSESGATGFSLDAVARKAGVVRMTVYYQFGSKGGLLEALFDDLAVRGDIMRLREVFAAGGAPRRTLSEFIAVIGHFYESSRAVIRRLNALAALDPDIERAIEARIDRRRDGAREIVRRLVAVEGPLAVDETEAVNVLTMLTSVETFHALAGGGGFEAVVPLVQRLADASLRRR